MKRNWMVKVTVNGFNMVVMVYGTENEVYAYVASEFGERNAWMSGATEEEVNAAKLLKMPIYMA